MIQLSDHIQVVVQAELLFSEVLNALSQMADTRFGTGPLNNGMKTSETRRQIAELEGMLQKEKAELEVSPYLDFKIHRLSKTSLMP